MAFLGTTVAEPHIRSGALKAIGISTKTRSQLLPNVPTLAEQSLANYDFGGWIAVIAPAGRSAPVVARLNADVNAAIASPEVNMCATVQPSS